MKNKYLILLAFLMGVLACQKEDPEEFIPQFSDPATKYSHKVPMVWNQLYLEMERFTAGYRPPVSARNSGYINLMAYEAIVAGSQYKYRSLSGYFDGLNITPPEPDVEYNWEVSLNAAYEKGFELFFPTAPSEQQFRLLDVSNDLRSELQSKSDDIEIYRRSAEYGRYVAETVFNWSRQDQFGHQAYLRNTDAQYTSPTGIGLWNPTYPDFLPPLLPHWGKVRTFGNQQSVSLRPPPEFSTSSATLFYREAAETRNLVNEVKAGKREEDYWIAEFWSDDCPILTFTPAGRWFSIANQIVAIEQPNMLETVVMYAKVGMALADAGIKCWDEKYKYNCMRPIEFIREHMDDPDWNTVMCPDGSGGYYTPNFPTYPSGHASFGASAAVVLESIFGYRYSFTDRSHEGRREFRGDPRKFDSIWDMALENGYSRIPLGVHFRADSNAGIELGRATGQNVLALPWQ